MRIFGEKQNAKKPKANRCRKGIEEIFKEILNDQEALNNDFSEETI